MRAAARRCRQSSPQPLLVRVQCSRTILNKKAACKRRLYGDAAYFSAMLLVFGELCYSKSLHPSQFQLPTARTEDNVGRAPVSLKNRACACNKGNGPAWRQPFFFLESFMDASNLGRSQCDTLC